MYLDQKKALEETIAAIEKEKARPFNEEEKVELQGLLDFIYKKPQQGQFTVMLYGTDISGKVYEELKRRGYYVINGYGTAKISWKKNERIHWSHIEEQECENNRFKGGTNE